MAQSLALLWAQSLALLWTPSLALPWIKTHGSAMWQILALLRDVPNSVVGPKIETTYDSGIRQPLAPLRGDP
jgi:hypothetical protein